ncbi:hypothetical protein GUJ93_ZPchr0014g47169 [Zizania palustris]|uniref:Uncharacterized protein n=1 Tax=Zizania palustris TaxID=103762 RepID=A0A8J5W0F7_ZIZPA|nr:hypothetical protein GUJ93_ZPchr0014g47169 [Zizania palustris]
MFVAMELLLIESWGAMIARMVLVRVEEAVACGGVLSGIVGRAIERPNIFSSILLISKSVAVLKCLVSIAAGIKIDDLQGTVACSTKGLFARSVYNTLESPS